MMGVVKIGNGNSQRFDTGSWPIFSTGYGNIDLLGALKASFNIILNFRGALAKVRPIMWVIGAAMLICSFRTPDDAGTGSGWVKASMGTVTLVCISELAVNLGAQLASKALVKSRVGNEASFFPFCP